VFTVVRSSRVVSVRIYKEKGIRARGRECVYIFESGWTGRLTEVVHVRCRDRLEDEVLR
jgi:hypothetical protein